MMETESSSFLNDDRDWKCISTMKGAEFKWIDGVIEGDRCGNSSGSVWEFVNQCGNR